MAGNPFVVQKTFNDQGYAFISIINYTNRTTYCYIKGYDYFVDFNVRANSQSRYYPEPYGKYIWRCK